MVVGLVSDIYDLVQKTRTEVAMVRCFLRRLVSRHLPSANDTLLYNSLGCLLHRLHHFLLFSLGKLLVKITAPLVLALAKLAVLTYDLLALVGAPDFVVELLFLIALVLDELDDHGLALLELQLFHIFLLLADQSSAALLTLFACRLSQGLLCALF